MICCKNWLGYDYHEAKGIAPSVTSLCAPSFFESGLRVVIILKISVYVLLVDIKDARMLRWYHVLRSKVQKQQQNKWQTTDVSILGCNSC